MFDVSFTELMLIGVVALVVIGPERLPKVARTVGHLLGRAQRYVSDVKTDIQREIDLDEVNKLKKQMDDAAQSLQASMRETSASIQDPLTQARKSLSETSASVESMMEQARKEVSPASGAQAAPAPVAAPAPAVDAAKPEPDNEPVPELEPLGLQETAADTEPTTTERSGTPK